MRGPSGARAWRARARRIAVGAGWLALVISGVTAITSEDYGSAKQRAKRAKRTEKTKHDLAKRRGAEAREFDTPNCPC